MADKTRSSPSQKRKRENTLKEKQKTLNFTGSDEDNKSKKLKTSFQAAKDDIKEKFKMEMPKDFFDFWEVCSSLNAGHPEDALKDNLGLELVGPYDILAGKFTGVDHTNVISYHLHWRYYYDPPEFQTVLKSVDNKSGYHIGYFRDDPKSLPVFLASCDSNIGCQMAIKGDNIFAAVSAYLSETLKQCKNKSQKDSLKKLETKLSKKASELDYTLSTNTASIKARNKLSNAKTFHKAGLCVPVDSNDVGYRPLTVSDGELKKILKAICASNEDSEKASEELQEIITYIQFANDECDYGMGLELGLDVFCFGNKRFDNLILQLMPLAYNLLGRDLFAEIIEVHVKNRDREELSVLK